MAPHLSRRDFFLSAGRFGLVAGGLYALSASSPWVKRLLSFSSEVYAASVVDDLAKAAPVARFWVSTSTPGDHCRDCHSSDVVALDPRHKHDEVVIKCLLCAQSCLIKNHERGKCKARLHVNGELRSLVYGRPITVHIDPIEKKPFYHFLPGSQAYSLATSGCPLQCQFCQNWEISQSRPEDYEAVFTPPADVVSNAVGQSVPVVAFTYNEPTVFFEYLTDIARAARERNLRSVLISCGFMNEAPLAEMCSVLDGIKIDLKGFDEDFYRKVCSAELKPVLRSIKQIADSGTHLEIVNLVVPSLNDSEVMLTGLCDWIVNEIGPDVPVHFTRFHPDYKLLNLAPTPVATLERARDIALARGMHFPYVGNVPGHPGDNTYCPKCGKEIITRQGFFITAMHMTNGNCDYCHEKIPGVWQ